MAGQLVEEFDIWREGYAAASVEVRVAGTTQLATIYSDADLTTQIDNPQILTSYQDGAGAAYGKFAQPVYCAVAYTLNINGTDVGGVRSPPLQRLDGSDVSNMLGKPRNSGRLRSMQDLLANTIYAEDYGEIGLSAATNTTTLETAIGQAAAVGGGDVILPAKTFPFNQITLSAGVRLVGAGKVATIMQSQVADAVITFDGVGCGLSNLTLDGINLTVGSFGIFGVNMEQTRLDNVVVKRFQVGIEVRGGSDNMWRDFSVENCASGARLLGDTNAGGGGDGAEWLRNQWSGGLVETCTTVGIYMSYEDTTVTNNLLEKLRFDGNTGIGLHLNGARFTHVSDCAFTDNTTNLKIEDDNLSTTFEMAKVVYARFDDCEIREGAISIEDTAEDIIFSGCNFVGPAFTLTLPQNNIILLNCSTDPDTTFAGDTTKINYFYETDEGSVAGRTTDATSTKAWSTGPLGAGEYVYIDAIAIGNQVNGNSKAVYRKVAKYRRAGFTLAYDAQTANFVLGGTLTGATSGATATIVADSDGGTTGTLTLRDVVGTFLDNEVISDGTGSALANGAVVTASVALLGSVETIGTDYEDVLGWNFTLTAAVAEVEATVTGAAATTIDWTVHVKAFYG